VKILLTEHEIARTWRVLFRENEINEETFGKAEALLEELRPESPLRHRLAGELAELEKMHKQKAAPRKAAAPPRKAVAQRSR
jgi:hypothetical protein